MYSSNYVWAKVIGYIENKIGAAAAATWFDDAEVVGLSEDKLVLYSPSPFRQDMIRQHCVQYIQEAMLEYFSMSVQVDILGEQEFSDRRVHDPVREKKPDFLVNNPQYTFDTFVVGPSNTFAHATSVAVANNPGVTYNPLFIYGPSGLGKTHLLYAIAAEIYRRQPELRMVYVKEDQFTNELIEGLTNGKIDEFRGKYRGADLLLMDDVQFIAGKASTEEEFFNTFNELFLARKQIVLTSDRPPDEMLKLEDRLRTRFQGAMLADITPPTYETRMAIIQSKSLSMGLEMPGDCCQYIAQKITTNIRQIEGVVKKISARHDLNKMEVNLSTVTKIIDEMYKGKADTLPTPDLIISEVSRYYSIPEETIRGSLKNKITSEARRLAMYLIRQITGMSLPDIGKVFGGKDHTTVLYAVRKVDEGLAKGDKRIAGNLKEITANINTRLEG